MNWPEVGQWTDHRMDADMIEFACPITIPTNRLPGHRRRLHLWNPTVDRFPDSHVRYTRDETFMITARVPAHHFGEMRRNQDAYEHAVQYLSRELAEHIVKATIYRVMGNQR